MAKALDILGLGACSLVRIPVDETFSVPVNLVRVAAQKAKDEGKIVLCTFFLGGIDILVCERLLSKGSVEMDKRRARCVLLTCD
jgi:hypothetical protein